MNWYVGRLIDHVHLRVRDFDLSRRFYLSILEALDHPGHVELGKGHLQVDELYIEAGRQAVSNVHLAFQARSESLVHAFYDAALANGGRSNGGPGLRSYHSQYYAAFVFDPDGNNIEAVYQGRTSRSAEQIHIRHTD